MLSAIATDLPARPAALIGRRQERERARALLLDEAVPLLTLTGPGGVGKTRLALAIAEDVGRAFVDGVVFVDLSPLSDPALVPDAVGRALGLPRDGSPPLTRHLRDSLRPRQVLLVLDNCEHVLMSAATLAAELLAGCPALQIVATSRAPLRLHAEHSLPLSPLAVPEIGTEGRAAGGSPEQATASVTALGEVEAVRLFVQRARQVRPDFALTTGNALAVAELCRRLDGLPLAIELAAARTRHLSAQALLARLSDRLTLLSGGPRDRPDRQQTLRDAIAWSYDLLTPEEQELFRRLAVFQGGFTLDAVEAISLKYQLSAISPTDDGASSSTQPIPHPPSPIPLDTVSALIDKSLLLCGDGVDGELRYGMLETIRVYGLDRLADSGEEAAARDCHARWCLALADRDWWGLTRAEEMAALDRIEREHDNIRAALTWLEQTGEVVLLLRLSGLLAHFWVVRSHRSEGWRRLDLALRAAQRADVPRPVRADAAVGAAALLRTQNNDEQATLLAAEALAHYRDIGDIRGVAATLNLLGALARGQKAYARARAFGEEALALWQELGDVGWTALALTNLGLAAHWQGDDAQAEPLLGQALASYRDLNDHWGIATVLNNLAMLAADKGDYERAATMQRESLEACLVARVKESLIDVLAGIAVVVIRYGIPDVGVRLHAAAAALADSIDYSAETPERERYEQSMSTARSALGAQSFEAASVAGLGLSAEQTVAEAQCVIDAVARGDRLAGLVPTTLPQTPADLFGFTPREREVLTLMAERLTDPEIAARLFLSPRTVERHVSNILGKLGAANRREAAALAARHCLA